MPPVLIDLVAERLAAGKWLAQQGADAPRDFRQFSVRLIQMSAPFKKLLDGADARTAPDALARGAGEDVPAGSGQALLLAFGEFRAGRLDAAGVETVALDVAAELLSIRRAVQAGEPAGTGDARAQLAAIARRHKRDAINQLWAWRRGEVAGLGPFEAAAGGRRDAYRAVVLGGVVSALASGRAAEPKPVAAKPSPAPAAPARRPAADRELGAALGGPVTRDRLAAVTALRPAAGAGDEAALLRSLLAEAHLRFSVASYDRAHAFALEAEQLIVAASMAIEPDLRARARMIRARAAGRRGATEEAMALLQAALVETPGNHLLYLRMAELLWPREPARALAFLDACRAMRRTAQVGDQLLAVHIRTQLGLDAQAEVDAFRTLAAFPQAADALLLLSNIHLRRGEADVAATMVAGYFGRFQLPAALPAGPGTPVLVRDAHCTGLPRFDDGPLVSVVMTAFNAADTIGYAIGSVLAQTHRNLELIVVDDRSEDDTCLVVQRCCAADPRVRLLVNERNAGTYVSKNRGIARSAGRYVALHDSDDWAHPHKIRAGVEALEGDADLVGTTSQWFRQDGQGLALMSRWQPSITHLNPASTFFRREVLDAIGYFDSVRVGADAEYLARMRLHFGPERVLADPRPLAIGLHHEKSLTQSGVNAFDDNRYSPVRAAYAEGWLGWHERSVHRSSTLILPSEPGERQFDIPESIDVPR